MENLGQAAVGIIVVLIIIGGLLYIFFSRSNAVEKTGYGSLIMLAVVIVMIPVFWITEASTQANANAQLQQTAVERGMALYASVCTDKCYGIKNDKVVNPKYNGYTISDLNQKMSDDDLKRIISAGVYNPALPTPANLAKSDHYGGQLSAMDVNYLFSFIRSDDAKYLKKQGFTSGPAAESGFKAFPAYLKKNALTTYDAAVSYATFGEFGKPVDKTAVKQLTITIIDSLPGATCDPSCYAFSNVQVKVGTVITWVNKSTQAHGVTALEGTNTTSPKVAPQIFDSGDANKLLQPNATFQWTVTDAAYNANPDHTVIYYCRAHPKMLAQLTIVK